MATSGDFVVVCTYAERDGADELVAEFRRKKIEAVVVPSPRVIGAWDVMAPARGVLPSRESVTTVLARS